MSRIPDIDDDDDDLGIESAEVAKPASMPTKTQSAPPRSPRIMDVGLERGAAQAKPKAESSEDKGPSKQVIKQLMPGHITKVKNRVMQEATWENPPTELSEDEVREFEIAGAKVRFWDAVTGMELFETGTTLIEMKAKISEGEFHRAVRSVMGLNEKPAQIRMQIAREFETGESISHMSQKQLLWVISECNKARSEAGLPADAAVPSDSEAASLKKGVLKAKSSKAVQAIKKKLDAHRRMSVAYGGEAQAEAAIKLLGEELAKQLLSHPESLRKAMAGKASRAEAEALFKEYLGLIEDSGMTNDRAAAQLTGTSEVVTVSTFMSNVKSKMSAMSSIKSKAVSSEAAQLQAEILAKIEAYQKLMS